MIYIHIPFCNSFCTYCDFYSEVASSCRKGSAEDFVAALESEITGIGARTADAAAAAGAPATLYIGGGTPSVLPLSAFQRIVSSLKRNGLFPEGGWKEFTVEVNPEDIVEKGEDFVEGLMEVGVNRISMGVQSFDDGILRWMNRRHDAARAVKAYSILENAGMENISIDLISGLPQLTMDGWMATLDRALSISSTGKHPAHISSYQLSIEPGSALARLIAQERIREADEEMCRVQYERLCSVLAAAGYHHYEISNFALPGHEAVHNSAYWDKVPYIGLGPGAHSYLLGGGRKIRRWNLPDLKAYIAAGNAGLGFAAVRGQEVLSAMEDREERVMLALRTDRGMSEAELRSCGEAGQGQTVDRLLAEGALEPVPGTAARLRIPESRLFVSDDILAELI